MRDYLWCMSLLEWLKFWSKFYRIPPILKYSFRIPPSPKNENCQRVQVREFQNTPPPPENWNLGRSWHFKTFQFQNIWYQWETMCGKLLHVETLSSADNYSLTFVWKARIDKQHNDVCKHSSRQATGQPAAWRALEDLSSLFCQSVLQW